MKYILKKFQIHHDNISRNKCIRQITWINVIHLNTTTAWWLKSPDLLLLTNKLNLCSLKQKHSRTWIKKKRLWKASKPGPQAQWRRIITPPRLNTRSTGALGNGSKLHYHTFLYRHRNLLLFASHDIRPSWCLIGSPLQSLVNFSHFAAFPSHAACRS